MVIILISLYLSGAFISSLMRDTYMKEYELEYGIDSLEIHQDALDGGRRVLLVDDLLATGGSASAAAQLVAACGATVAGTAFLVELLALGGREPLAAACGEAPIAALLQY